MRIAFVCDTNPFFTSSAISNRYEGLLRGLTKEKVEIHLFVCSGYNCLKEYYYSHLLRNENLIIHYCVPLLNSSLFFRRINKYVLSHYIIRKCDKAIKRVFDSHFDYCWLAGGDSIRQSFLRCKNAKTSRVIMEFSEFQELYRFDSTLTLNEKNRLQKEFEVTCSVINNLDCIIVMTKRLMQYYRSLIKRQIPLLHLPMTVDLSRFRSLQVLNNFNRPYIAYSGTYSNIKDGIDILINAFSAISQKYPQYTLYMAGFYHYDVPKQKELILRLGLENRIIYLGVLTKEQIPELICNAELLVLSRPDSRQAQGGFPTKLGEYLATGKPVCVTRVGEIPDYLVDNESAFMATPGDVDSFADAMDRALSDKENARRVGLNGRKVAEENFSVDVQSKRLVKFLEDNLRCQ